MNPRGRPRTKRPIFKMRSMQGRLYRSVRGTSSFAPVGSNRVVIDLTEDDSEDDIVQITQVTSRQSARSRLNSQMMAAVQPERYENSDDILRIRQVRSRQSAGSRWTSQMRAAAQPERNEGSIISLEDDIVDITQVSSRQSAGSRYNSQMIPVVNPVRLSSLEDDSFIVRITQVSSRQSAGSRWTSQMRAVFQPERNEGSVRTLEEDIVRITQVSSRQSSRLRLNSQMLAGIQPEGSEDSVSSVEDVTGDDEENSVGADEEMRLGYAPVEGCIRAQIAALALELQQRPRAEGQGRPTVRTIRLTSSEGMRERWGENGNPNNFLILRVQAKQRTNSFEVAALRKNLTVVSEVIEMELHKLQRAVSKQLQETALRIKIAEIAQEMAEADKIKREKEARAKELEEADKIKKEKEAKAKEMKQKEAQEMEEADEVNKLEQARKAKRPSQEKQPVENKRAKKF